MRALFLIFIYFLCLESTAQDNDTIRYEWTKGLHKGARNSTGRLHYTAGYRLLQKQECYAALPTAILGESARWHSSDYMGLSKVDLIVSFGEDSVITGVHASAKGRRRATWLRETATRSFGAPIIATEGKAKIYTYPEIASDFGTAITTVEQGRRYAILRQRLERPRSVEQ